MNYKSFLKFMDECDESQESACRRLYIENQETIKIKKRKDCG
jgi:hypothetical protein